MADEVKRCKKDLHDLVGNNVGVQKSTGRIYCKPCRATYLREKRKHAERCPKGHSWANASAWYETATGQKRCRRCWLVKKKAKEDAVRAAAVAAAAATRVPRRPQVRAMSPRRRGHGDETDARYRLAVSIRRGRGIDVRG